MVKNPPANAGATGLIPGPGRPNLLWGSEGCGPPLLSPCSATEATGARSPHARSGEQPSLAVPREGSAHPK